MAMEIKVGEIIALAAENATLKAQLAEKGLEKSYQRACVLEANARIRELKSQLAEIAERDRWRVTAKEPPTEKGFYETNGEYPFREYCGGGFGKWTKIGFVHDQVQPTYYRPLRTDKPIENNQ